jgi:uncharacterized membrane protein YkoI
MSTANLKFVKLALAGLLTIFAASSFAVGSFALEGEALSKEAGLTLDQARAAALKAQPGTILDLELEHRKGGSGLRYSFDIKVGNAIHEVGIDAKTGATLINHTEGAK